MPVTERSDLAKHLHQLVTYLHTTANRDLLEQIREESLSFQRIQLLERLRGGRVRPTVTQCARIMHVSETGASRMIDELAGRGLVKRVPDETDSRARRVQLTDAGQQVLVRLHAARMPAIRDFTATLSDSQAVELEHAIAHALHDDQIAHAA